MTVNKTTTKSTYQGKPVEMVTLKNKNGIELTAISYGGIITSLKVPDRAGTFADVVLGFDTLENYWADPPPPFFGAIVGRYGNRIAKGKFALGGKTYARGQQRPNHLHGGNRASTSVWAIATKDSLDGSSAIFTPARRREAIRALQVASP